MKIRLLLLFALITILAAPSNKSSKNEDSFPSINVKKIRVLLDAHNATKETKFIIKSLHGFLLKSPVDSHKRVVYKENELRLICKNGHLYLKGNDQRYLRIKNNSIEIYDPHRKLTLGSTTYQGRLIIRIDEAKNMVLVINKLPLEDYVYSVVRYESIPSWPLAMQKIQAICSRSYAVFLMQQHKNQKNRLYDIKNTNVHQVYNGTHAYTHLREAVEQTKDMVLTYKGKVALAEFDICCGGVKSSLMKHKNRPYLHRSNVCNYCNQSSSYRWKADVHEHHFLQTLKNSSKLSNKLKHFKGPITDIKVNEVDKAGIVYKVKIFDKDKKLFVLTGNNIRGPFLHKIKSTSFIIQKIRDRIVISGKGYGHQRGACQWGCKELVKRGWNIQNILNFYYPGTTLGRLV